MPTTLEDTLGVTIDVAKRLDALNLEYVVGGSVASSVHGRARTTEDIDLVVKLPGARIQDLVTTFEADFYIDADMIRDAILRRASFNVIHLATMIKVDIFVFDGRDHAVAEMERKLSVELRSQPVWFASAEDIVLQKLIWFERGNRIGGDERSRRAGAEGGHHVQVPVALRRFQ